MAGAVEAEVTTISGAQTASGDSGNYRIWEIFILKIHVIHFCVKKFL